MTQFIIATGGADGIEPPQKIRLRRIEGHSFATETAARLFSGYRGPLFKIEEQDSGEADRLVDEIHNTCRSGPAEEPALLQLLRALVNQGCSVACWYGSEVEDIPVFCTWEAFIQAVLRDASEQPPEIYAVFRSH